VTGFEDEDDDEDEYEAPHERHQMGCASHDGVSVSSSEQLSAAPSGRFFLSANPGLKPWANLYNRFAVRPTAKALLPVNFPNPVDRAAC